MQPKLLDPGAPSIQDLAAQLAAAIAALPGVDAQVQALNDVRRALHEGSPLRHHPVDFVEWVPAADVRANSYNPNSVPPPEFTVQPGGQCPFVAIFLDVPTSVGAFSTEVLRARRQA